MPLTLALVRKKHINAARMVELLSVKPAGLLGTTGGSLGPGSEADIAVIDPELRFTLQEQDILSKGKNSPFIGTRLQGRVVLTICRGRITYNLLSP